MIILKRMNQNRWGRTTIAVLALMLTVCLLMAGCTGLLGEKELKIADWDLEAAEKGNFDHFMIKESHMEE